MTRERAALAPDPLPPLREVIAKHGLKAKKSLGQNYLLDLNLTGRIARAAGPLQGVSIYEVGPGPGGLTRALLSEGAAHVLAVEQDSRAIPALEEVRTAYPNRLAVHRADALSFDPTPHLSQPARIVANLPYNVGTPLLIKWLSIEPWPPWFDRMVLMFQKEVAERIVAQPGSKTYGRLSVLSQWRCRVRKTFDIEPRAFTPPPSVVSTVVTFTPKDDARPLPVSAVEKVTAAAFGQRRKMIRASLKPLASERCPLEEIFEKSGIPGTRRAEELSIDQFLDLAALFLENGEN